jgi:hypothetical protein
MPVREDYPFVGRSGYRVGGSPEPGMRSALTEKPRPHPQLGNGGDRTPAANRALASARAGFGR